MYMSMPVCAWCTYLYIFYISRSCAKHNGPSVKKKLNNGATEKQIE